MKRLIILFGAPVEKTGMKKVSTGDFFRSEVKQQTLLGKIVASRVKQGDLLSDFIVNPVIENAFSQILGDIILDGYPRTFSQFGFLKELVEREYTPLCVYVDTKIDDILSRISQRRVCEDCGTTHFASQGCCPKCGGRSLIREDDERILERINQYSTLTLPVLEERIKYWCRVVSVNGLNTKESVAQVLEELKNL